MIEKMNKNMKDEWNINKNIVNVMTKLTSLLSW